MATDWTFFLGGNDRVHLWCARCDTSVTVLLPVRLDEMGRFGRAYVLCHRGCRRTLWNERTRLLRVLGRRPLPGGPAQRQEPSGEPG